MLGVSRVVIPLWEQSGLPPEMTESLCDYGMLMVTDGIIYHNT